MTTEQKLCEARRRGVRRMARLRRATKVDPTLTRFLQIAEAMDTGSIFTVLGFLLSKNREFGGKTALDLLQAGEVERVMAEARTFFKHGA